MNHTVEFDANGSFVTITTFGDPTPAGFAAYLTDMLDDPKWQPGMPMLVDLTRLNISILSSDDVRSIVSAHKPFAERIAPSTIAAVVSEQDHYGLVRMFQMMSDEMLQNLRGYYTVEEAMAWLGI